MELYILRHAIAVDRTEWKGSEAERPLTDDGRRKMKKIAAGIAALKLEFAAVLTSPYRRAYETAQMVVRELNIAKSLRLSRSLAPDGDPKVLVRHLALDFRSWESVLIVGHEPYLSRLIGTLTVGTAELSLELKKGGLAKLTADSLTLGKCAKLEWLIAPKILRAL